MYNVNTGILSQFWLWEEDLSTGKWDLKKIWNGNGIGTPTPVQNPLMSRVRLSSLSMTHVHKDEEIELNKVISDIAGKKDRWLALCL